MPVKEYFRIISFITITIYKVLNFSIILSLRIGASMWPVYFLLSRFVYCCAHTNCVCHIGHNKLPVIFHLTSTLFFCFGILYRNHCIFMEICLFCNGILLYFVLHTFEESFFFSMRRIIVQCYVHRSSNKIKGMMTLYLIMPTLVKPFLFFCCFRLFYFFHFSSKLMVTKTI